MADEAYTGPDQDRIQSAATACADIQRLLLLIAINRRISQDRRADIVARARMIIDHVEKL